MIWMIYDCTLGLFLVFLDGFGNGLDWKGFGPVLDWLWTDLGLDLEMTLLATGNGYCDGIEVELRWTELAKCGLAWLEFWNHIRLDTCLRLRLLGFLAFHFGFFRVLFSFGI